MPTGLPKNIIKLAVALLKHQTKLWLGEEAVGIAGETLVEIGGEEIQAKVDKFLSTTDGERELLKAAQRANEYFHEHCQDDTLRQAFTLSFGDLASVQEALTELPTALDTSQVETALQTALLRDIPSLTPEQATQGAKLYVESLQRALLQVKDFTLPIIGQTVLDNQNKLMDLGYGQKEILATLQQISTRLGQSPTSSMSTPTLPGGLPPGSYLPFIRNVLFTGREKDIQYLAENLLKENSTNTVISQAVTGMGGIGKTQLAVEFAWRYGYRFKGVHWLDLHDSQVLDGAIALCGTKMGYAQTDQRELVAATLQTWMAEGPRLLILDNFEEVTQANDVLVHFQHPSLRLLVTSRRRDFPKSTGLQVQQLDLFSETESLDFLEKTLEHIETPAARKTLAETLGHLPLALELAANYINIAKMGIDAYLKELADLLGHESMQAEWFQDLEIPNPTKHDQSLFATFQLSWQEVKDEIQQKIFMLAGYCAPNTPIPLEIFKQTLGLEEKTLSKALYRLSALGLLPLANELPSIHPLLAAYARTLARSSKGLLENVAEKLARLAKEANEQVDQTGNLGWFAPLRPHILSVAEFGEEAGVSDAANLLGYFGYYSEKKIADYHGAKVAYERALKIAEATHGADHPEVALAVNNLGGVLYELDDLAGAKASCERALKIAEAAYGADNPAVAMIINNLGRVLYELGDLAGAKASFERALKIDEATYGADHSTVAIRVNNLGRVLHALSDLAGAKASYERALKIDEATYGADHPEVAILVNNLGMVLRDLGDLAGAKASFERALKIAESTYGTDHPEAALAVNNLGRVLHDLSDLAGAKASFERALKIDEATYGADHPAVARDVNNLGMVLMDLDDLAGAKASFERALKIDEATYGTDHPEVAINVNNLGRVLHDLSDLAGAKASFERALKIDESTYGADHPKVAINVNNLGSVLHALSDLAEAKAAFERALKIDEATYGTDHPAVARDVNNLGMVLMDLGDLAGAKAAFERTLKIAEATYGADHPEVALAVNNLGSVLQALDDLAGAKASYERALKILKKFLPERHLKIKMVQRNLDGLSNKE